MFLLSSLISLTLSEFIHSLVILTYQEVKCKRLNRNPQTEDVTNLHWYVPECSRLVLLVYVYVYVYFRVILS